MRILTRYILRAHAGPFLFAFTALTSILLVNGVARQLESLAGKGLPSSVFVEFVLYSLPYIVAQTIPMGVLVAVLHTFSQLSADNEIAALKASGVNLQRLLIPPLLASVAVAGIMVFHYDRVLPGANHRLLNLTRDVARKAPTLQLQEQVLNPIASADNTRHYYLQASTIDPATNRMLDVVIYDLSTPGKSQTIYADSGRLAFHRDSTDLLLDLRSGWINEADASTPTRFYRTFFSRGLLRLRGIGNKLEHSDDASRTERDMTLAMLRRQVGASRKELSVTQNQIRTVQRNALDSTLAGMRLPRLPPVGVAVPGPAGSAPLLRSMLPKIPDPVAGRTAAQMRALRDQLALNRDVLNMYLVEYYKKWALPFASIVFVLIGAPLALRFPRGGTGAVVAVSLAIFSVYYVSLIGGETLSEKGYLSPFLAMWAANILFLFLSIFGVATMASERSSSSHGSWADVLDTLRDAVKHPFRRR